MRAADLGIAAHRDDVHLRALVVGDLGRHGVLALARAPEDVQRLPHVDGRLEEDDVVSGGDDVDSQHRLVNVDQKLDVVEAKLAWAIPGEEKWILF